MRGLGAAVNLRFQGGVQQPDTLWTDRGKSFYSPNNGVMTVGYKEALREHHFKAALGENASVQPGNLQELMLHDRCRMASSTPGSDSPGESMGGVKRGIRGQIEGSVRGC